MQMIARLILIFATRRVARKLCEDYAVALVTQRTRSGTGPLPFPREKITTENTFVRDDSESNATAPVCTYRARRVYILCNVRVSLSRGNRATDANGCRGYSFLLILSPHLLVGRYNLPRASARLYIFPGNKTCLSCGYEVLQIKSDYSASGDTSRFFHPARIPPQLETDKIGRPFVSREHLRETTVAKALGFLSFPRAAAARSTY